MTSSSIIRQKTFVEILRTSNISRALLEHHLHRMFASSLYSFAQTSIVSAASKSEIE